MITSYLKIWVLQYLFQMTAATETMSWLICNVFDKSVHLSNFLKQNDIFH